MKIIVRKFQEKDVDAVLEIFNSDGLIHNEDERERTRKGLRKNAVSPEWYDHFLVAEIEGKVVGRVLLEAAYPPYSELINIYVLPTYQRRGVGASLVQECIKKAAASKCSVMSVMADPVGNLPAHKIYSKFGFKPGILGDPSKQRGHMWLFRFSEESCVSEFLKRHPFAEPSVSPSRVDFHDRILYRMSWRDPQTVDRIDLFIEGQPSQTPEGTMARIAGCSYKEKDTALDVLVQEQTKTIKQGGNSNFTISLWNLSSKPTQITLNTSIPNGMILTPQPQEIFPIKIDQKNEKTMQFELTWPSSYELPMFTTFSTVPATCYFIIENFENPLFGSAGFEKTT